MVGTPTANASDGLGGQAGQRINGELLTGRDQLPQNPASPSGVRIAWPVAVALVRLATPGDELVGDLVRFNVGSVVACPSEIDGFRRPIQRQSFMPPRFGGEGGFRIL
jgi:hypothetical protein